MVYRRVQPKPVAENLWEYKPTKRTSDDDVIKISFSDGGVLFVERSSEGHWRPIPDLLPELLRKQLEIQGTHWVILNQGEFGQFNAVVGYSLAISLEGLHWKTDAWFSTTGAITRFKSVKRKPGRAPTGLDGKMKSFTASDY